MNDTDPLKALVLVCSLSKSPKDSSSELLAQQVLKELEKYNVKGSTVRAVDHDIKPGVEIDMGDGDAWPQIRQQIMDSDILIIATPIWVGHTCSVAQRIIERLDAELSEKDDEGRLLTYGKVGAAVVVGNEDGAHNVCADLFQALNDVGFTIPAGSGTYWVGEAMNKVDFKDLKETPEMVKSSNKSLAANVAHLARLLKANPYPPSK